MPLVDRKTEERVGITADAIPYADLVAQNRPVVLKGAVADWPLVGAGRKGADQALDYLARFDGGRPIVAFRGDGTNGGRFFYNEDVTGFNFTAQRLALPDALGRIRDAIPEEASTDYYVGSTDLDLFLPGFREENDLPLDHAMFEGAKPLVSLWLGNRSIATAHFDMSYNMALCLVGRRRFTLFPPDQTANLYPGPLEPTPGGQVVSMVRFDDPDLSAFPNFEEAMAHAEVAELEPGDLLFYPAMWWHHVEALERFNAMVNYWWNLVPRHIDTPMTTLLHGMLSLRDRPQAEKEAWRSLFDYYVFGEPERPRAHLPAHAHGDLGPMDPQRARALRAKIINKLNR